MSTRSNTESKICSWEEARQRVKGYQQQGLKVVFTNGCFDILHFGHLCYLAQARDLGGMLVVGLNSAASVARLKGPHRPIQDEATRFFQMAALAFTDVVVGFEQDTPLDLIATLRPDILVKGGDYAPDDIVGAGLVKSYGGTVAVLPFVPGYSTTGIEQKILDGILKK
jgi:D-beta-D-heptose 7-phosphate kinase/D-beta-D-heptose 1-phosphate adenosyltransferase